LRSAPRSRRAAALLAAAALALANPPKALSDWSLSTRATPATVWSVGDGADGSPAAMRVADVIAGGQPDRVLYLGDVYEDGTAAEFAENYAPVFGRFDAIAAPTPGNHEWSNRGEGYYAYWGDIHGGPVPDFYGFRAGGWQLLSLNSEADHVQSSAQLRWLRDRLRSTPAIGTCRIAFWHRPRYSAGLNGDQEDIEPFWRVLANRASIIVNGHDHDMQRMKRRRGIVEFVSGAGGHKPRDVDETDPRLAFARDGVQGALKLVLRRRSARWAFVTISGRTLDSGRLRCRRSGRR
jgi:hypothetical protein